MRDQRFGSETLIQSEKFRSNQSDDENIVYTTSNTFTSTDSGHNLSGHDSCFTLIHCNGMWQVQLQTVVTTTWEPHSGAQLIIDKEKDR